MTPQLLPLSHSLYETQSLMMESSHILLVVVKYIGASLGGAQLYQAALPEVNGAYCIGAFPTRARLLAFCHELPDSMCLHGKKNKRRQFVSLAF